MLDDSGTNDSAAFISPKKMSRDKILWVWTTSVIHLSVKKNHADLEMFLSNENAVWEDPFVY